MEKVKEEWSSAYRKQQIELERGISDIDIFDYNVAKFLSESFKPGHLVLEAGCGTGRFCFWLINKGLNCIGVDIVPEMVKKATAYARKKGLPASFVICDVCNLPFRDNSIDGYISFGVVEHFRSTTEVIKAFREGRRVLKNGGRALITIPNIFVPLRNRLLLWMSKGRIGLFHEFYTLNDIRYLGQIIGSDLRVEVFDLWLPIYNVFDGVLKRIKIQRKKRRQIRYAFTKLTQPSILRYFLGYIYLCVNKQDSGKQCDGKLNDK